GDMEMWLRFARHGDIGFIDADQAVYRRHQGNMSLAYLDGLLGLPDLEQRKAALDCFFADSKGAWPDPDRLRRRTYDDLAVITVAMAGQTFNRGDVAECERILEFAIRLSPAVRRSREWSRVMWKRRMGVRLWSAVHPLLLTVRRRAPAW